MDGLVYAVASAFQSRLAPGNRPMLPGTIPASLADVAKEAAVDDDVIEAAWSS
jgi:hypothetical protein